MRPLVSLLQACALVGLILLFTPLTSCDKERNESEHKQPPPKSGGPVHGNDRTLWIAIYKTVQGCDVDYQIVNVKKANGNEKVEWYSNDGPNYTSTYEVRFDQDEHSPFASPNFRVDKNGSTPKPGRPTGNEGYYRYTVYAADGNPCKAAGEKYTINDPGVHVTP
jgi:hypothetical protein